MNTVKLATCGNNGSVELNKFKLYEVLCLNSLMYSTVYTKWSISVGHHPSTIQNLAVLFSDWLQFPSYTPAQ